MVVYAGQRIRAGDIPYVTGRAKASSESVTASTVMQNDDDLSVVLTPGLWRIELIATVSGNGGDIEMTWSTTGTMTVVGRSPYGPQLAMSDTENTTIYNRPVAGSSLIEMGTEADPTVIRDDLLIEVTVTGTLQFRWTQGGSNANATTLSASSRMFITPIVEY